MLRLPDELILCIAAQMNTDSEVNALATTNLRLFLCVDDFLYQRDAQRPSSRALEWALICKEERTVMKAVEAGATITIQMLKTPKRRSNATVSMVKLLVDLANFDPRITCDGRWTRWTPLWYAVDVGYDPFVTSHLDSDQVDFGARDASGRTLLWQAAYRGLESTTRLLLESDKIDADAKDPQGDTALTQAVKNGHESVVRVLLDSGKVDVNSIDHRQLLGLAAWHGWPPIVKLLLEAGLLECDTVDEKGRSPLSRAVLQGQELVVQLLVESERVDVNLPDGRGRTPLWYAVYEGENDAIVELLLSKGAVDLHSESHCRN